MYNLTFRLSGNDDLAGYYALYNQQADTYRKAGGGQFIWKAGSTFYAGPTNGNTLTAIATASVLSGPWTVTGSPEEVITFTDTTIGDAWSRAENQIFASLLLWFGGKDEVDAFQGYFPINADNEPKQINVWKMSSGGSAGAFDASRTYGTSGAWCSMLINADLTGIFVSRELALNFCGAVEAWLKETGNFNAIGNVTWCHLRDLPESPQERIIGRKRFWEVSIPLEILYLTEGEHAD